MDCIFKDKPSVFHLSLFFFFLICRFIPVKVVNCFFECSFLDGGGCLGTGVVLGRGGRLEQIRVFVSCFCQMISLYIVILPHSSNTWSYIRYRQSWCWIVSSVGEGKAVALELPSKSSLRIAYKANSNQFVAFTLWPRHLSIMLC